MPRRYRMGRRVESIQETQRRVQNALGGLLATKPYGTITLADIAAKADVSVRTVQRHYVSKDQILVALCLYSLEWVDAELTKAPTPKSAQEAIGNLMQAQFRFYEEHDAQCWAAFTRMRETPEIAGAMQAAAELWSAHIEALISDWPDAWAVERKRVKPMVGAQTSYPVWLALTQFGRFRYLESVGIATELLCRYLLSSP